MAEYRRLAIAAGHSVTVYRANRVQARAGYVAVRTSHRAPFEVREQVWNAGVPA